MLFGACIYARCILNTLKHVSGVWRLGLLPGCVIQCVQLSVCHVRVLQPQVAFWARARAGVAKPRFGLCLFGYHKQSPVSSFFLLMDTMVTIVLRLLSIWGRVPGPQDLSPIHAGRPSPWLQEELGVVLAHHLATVPMSNTRRSRTVQALSISRLSIQDHMRVIQFIVSLPRSRCKSLCGSRLGLPDGTPLDSPDAGRCVSKLCPHRKAAPRLKGLQRASLRSCARPRPGPLRACAA